jgi:transcriptional regulator with GAF, ATPase, and Fis domain
VIERAIIVTPGSDLRLIDSLESAALEAEPEAAVGRFETTEGDSENDTLEQSEYKLILRTLRKAHWRVEGPRGAAMLLKIHPSTLRSRMKKLGIARPRVQTPNHLNSP